MGIKVDFDLIFASYTRNDYRMKLRSTDERFDLGKRRKDERYWIYSSEKINSLILDHKSKYSKEPRPYVYFVAKEELKDLFPTAKIELLDAKSYTKEEKDAFLRKLR